MQSKIKISVGSDHAGFEFKRRILEILGHLNDKKYDPEDAGTFNNDASDYPDAAIKVAGSVSEGKADRGVLVCGSGIGMSMVANKFPGVRAALVTDLETAKLSRLHNDANVLILGERVLAPGLLPEILKIWFETAFEGGRHQRRLDKISELENKLFKR